jgi:adenylate kinase
MFLNMDSSLRTVVFFGASGSGKGTQAELLAKHLKDKTGRDAIVLETGELLREFAKGEGYTQNLVGEAIGAGKLLPSFMPVYVNSKALAERFTGEEHIIFDGVARRDAQVLMLDSMLRFYNRVPYDVVSLELSAKSATERLTLRGRSDDDAEKIQRRIQWYEKEVKPLIEKFKSFDGVVHTVDGEPSIEEIHKNVLSVLGLSQ